VIYPAQTWPHKNHINLLKAVAILRDRGLNVPLVFTGRRNAAAARIDRAIDELNLRALVTWLGFVEPDELMSALASADALVVPSRFEAASGPVWEAFAAGVPAACSAVTSLPEQLGDAGILFDPDDPADIAEAIRRLWCDEALRSALVNRGRERVAQFSWDRTALTFRAHYRRVAGRRLDESDAEFLATPPGI
jgi:glycosyltransferase involved in cell wall biosynthesis